MKPVFCKYCGSQLFGYRIINPRVQPEVLSVSCIECYYYHGTYEYTVKRRWYGRRVAVLGGLVEVTSEHDINAGEYIPVYCSD